MMNPNAMPKDKAAEATAQKQGAGGGPETIISDMQQALFQLNEGIQGSPLPVEAQKHLSAALGEYNQFMSIAGKAMGLEMPAPQGPVGQGSDMSAGNKGAVPADQPMGKDVRPIPAYG